VAVLVIADLTEADLVDFLSVDVFDIERD